MENEQEQRDTIYTTEGWLDVKKILALPATFFFILSGRGTGKTFGFLEELTESHLPFIFLRRRPGEAAMQASPVLSSLLPVLSVQNREFEAITEAKNVWTIYDKDSHEPICLCGALSTLAGTRGANFELFDMILFDEFIPEPHQRKIPAEGTALQNLYETVNRNRELTGKKACRLVCLANSFDVAHDALRKFGLIELAEEMLQTGEEVRVQGDCALIISQRSPVSEKKKSTTLYRQGNKEFSDFALGNKFLLNDFSYIVPRVNLQEYKPILKLGAVYLYKHKDRMEYYGTTTPAKVPKEYNDNINDLIRLRREQRRYWIKYLDGRIRFNSYGTARLFETYYKGE